MNTPETITPTVSVSPIADLSYRNYDGPLNAHKIRWWAVAISNLRIVYKKPAYWVLCILALLPYLWSGIYVYFTGGISSLMPMGDNLSIRYSNEFILSLERQQYAILFIALLAGTGSISEDIRSNALLIYLSRPLIKADYLLGKWMGIFIPVYSATVVPALILYIFFALTFTSKGFLKSDPYLILHMLIATLIPPIVHSSLLIGFSAWSKSARIAGAAYAGLCIVTIIISSTLFMLQLFGKHIRNHMVDHCSVFGVISGMARWIYKAKFEDTKFGDYGPMKQYLPITHEFMLVMFISGIALCVIGIIMARLKVKAVEVVKG